MISYMVFRQKIKDIHIIIFLNKFLNALLLSISFSLIFKITCSYLCVVEEEVVYWFYQNSEGGYFKLIHC